MLAHLGVAPLTSFFKDGGELVYLTPARRNGDGTFARVRLPLGVTADMVAGRRATLAASLGRVSLQTWPTKADEDGVLDLWIADKGKLGGKAGDWPLLHEGTVDLVDGVPFGLSQHGLIVNAPLLESDWLIGGRPGQGETSAVRTLLLGAALDPTAELWVFVMGESPDFEPLVPRLSRYRVGMDDAVAVDAVQALAELTEEMERRVRTHTVLTRLATHNPGEYDGWAFADLSATLAAHGIHPAKSHGVMVIRADDITAARTARAPSGEHGECGDSAGEAGSSPQYFPRTNHISR